jgi:hypothetical protein
MSKLHVPQQVPGGSLITILVIALWALAAGGCSRVIKNKVSVAPLVPPQVEAETAQLLAEVNRVAQVRSLRGKVDIQFLDNSFVKCGVAEKYRTAEGSVTLQRPGQIYISIQVPFFSTKVAEMASDGRRFEVAVFQGDEKYRRFVRGTNTANYQKLDTDGAAGDVDCGDQKKGAMVQQRAVGALSGLRPHHLTDALLVPAIESTDDGLLYARSEAFAEDADDRPAAKKGARVVRSYYTLDELAPEGAGRARLLRRFWFDRSAAALRLARMQTFDARGQIVTDVLYKNPRPFGADAKYTLPADIELTRPQDRYSLRISYQTPEDVKVDQPYESSAFVLENRSNLTEVDLDKEEQ